MERCRGGRGFRNDTRPRSQYGVSHSDPVIGSLEGSSVCAPFAGDGNAVHAII